MSLIENELSKIDFIVTQFDSDRNVDYKSNMENITNKIKVIIDKFAKSYGLVSSNNVRDIKHYTFISRIKESESLREKFVRNNLHIPFNEFIDTKFDSEDPDLIQNVKKTLLKIDDLIGIKILTDLDTDCVKMFELIKSSEFEKAAKAQDIILNKEDILKQPVSMRNGLKIYKIKGTFDKFNFELQIKSKIISAWGDMEHSIFYKDYAISPVRDTAQTSMNHVGKLLYQIDDFVESIRSANKDYTKNANALHFLQWIETYYSHKIKELLNNISYGFNSISELLYAVYNHLDITDEIAQNELKFNHFHLKIGDDGISQEYVNSRNEIFEFKILESIVQSWLLKEENINQENLQKNTDVFLNTLIDSTSKFLIVTNTGYDFDEMKQLITNYYKIGFSFECSATFILNLKKLNSFLELTYLLNDLSEGSLESNKLAVIKNCVFIQIYNGNVNKYVDINPLEVDKNNLKLIVILMIDELKKNLKKEKKFDQLMNSLQNINDSIN